MKVEIRTPERSEASAYLKRDRFTASPLWIAVMRGKWETVGIYADGKLNGIAAINRERREVRLHGGDEQTVKTVLSGLGEGVWELFDFPFEHAGALGDVGTVEFGESATLYVLKRRKGLAQEFHGTVSALRPGDATLVHERWGLDPDPEMTEVFRRRIRCGPTSAIFKSGRPVAWVGTYHHTPWTTQLGYLHVEKEHRKRGLGRAVSVDIINKVLKRGRTPVVHVFDSNRASKRLVRLLGFVPATRRIWGSLTIGKT